MKNKLIEPYWSVDCVLIGYDGEQLCTLLVKKVGTEHAGNESQYKLPGSLLQKDEELDDAAIRVITELTGLHKVKVHQFHTFGSPSRLRNEKDRAWLEHFYSINSPTDRIVTVAYTTLLKIERRHLHLSDKYEACWMPVSQVPRLAFDHNKILKAALLYVRQQASLNDDIIMRLLPRKFTILQLRRLFETIYNHTFDARNFHKQVAKMEHIVPLDEWEKNVSHRAARLHKYK